MKTHPAIILLLSLCLTMPSFGAPAPKPRPRSNPEAESLRRDLARFPDIATCRAYIAVGEKHLTWIDYRIALLPFERAEWTDYRMQVVGALEVWRDLETAHEYSQYAWSPEYGRRRLDRVREAIGEEAYWFGYLPPPFAVHAMPQGE